MLDSLLLLGEVVQGKVKFYRKKKIDSRYCEKCSVERIMYPLGFVCPSCGVYGDNIFVVGYYESTLIHKKRKCICKKEMNIFDQKLESSYAENLLICNAIIRGTATQL